MSNHVERLKDKLELLKYRRGDDEALGRLISRWQRRIFAYIRTTLADDQSAWDVSQEVWIAVVEAARGRGKIRRFSPWLYRVAHNKCVTHLRKKGRRGQEPDAATGVVHEPPAAGSDPVVAAEDIGLVTEAILELPLTQREAVTLFYLDELSVKEISEILDAPVGTIQSRLHHGRLKLRTILSKRGYRNG